MKKIERQKKGIGTMISIGILFTIIALFCMFLIFMLVWALLTSLKNPNDFSIIYNHNVIGFPTIAPGEVYDSTDYLFKFKNYVAVFKSDGVRVANVVYYTMWSSEQVYKSGGYVTFAEMILNTLLYCGLGAFCNVLVYTITGYLCGKYKEFKYGSVVETVIVVAMAIPMISSQAAELYFLKTVGIFDTWFAHIFLSSNFAGVYTLVFAATYRGMSDGYIEAAEIDGASQLRTFLFIAVPLQMKLITTVFLLNFISFWNIYESPMIYFPTHPTLAVGMSKMREESQNLILKEIPGKLAACMVLAIPIFVMFCFLHKKIMGKVSLGGIKE